MNGALSSGPGDGRPEPAARAPTRAGPRVRGDEVVGDAELPPTWRRIVLGDGVSMAIRREVLAVVVEVNGIADGAWARQLGDELATLEPDERVVVDLSDATLVSPAALCELIDEVVAVGEDPDRLCLVCERLSTQVLLRRYGATEQSAVFASVNDALQAALLQVEGYGEGWRPHAHHGH